MIKIDIPWRSIAKYVLASAVTGAVLFLLPHSTGMPLAVSTTEKVISVGQTLVLTAIGGGIYLAILMAIDKEARTLPKAILQEIRGKRKLLA
jgi:peptidoglycan biosynthesis protein MviN/MurJ (putative lipid II flippase)